MNYNWLYDRHGTPVAYFLLSGEIYTIDGNKKHSFSILHSFQCLAYGVGGGYSRYTSGIIY